MKTLIFSDPHIDKNNIKEQEEIFPEILSYKADRVICLGDYFERKILNDDELIFGTRIAKEFASKYPEVYILEGNHDKNTVKYLKEVGVKVVESLILDNNFYGHFFVDESIKSFNSAKVPLKDLSNYNYVFLGHQHSFQALGDKRFHPGSTLYVDFGEVDDVSKNIFMLENDKVEIIELKTPIPMIDVFKRSDLDKLSSRYKVRYVIKEFKQLKEEANDLEEYKDKFYQFKIKLDFQSKNNDVDISPKKNIDEIINDWLQTIKDVDVRGELQLTFKEKL